MSVESLKRWAKRIKCDVVAVYYAARDRRTPMLARVLALAVAAYALSPVDLIPDFIPIIGYLDDLVIVPLGLLLVIRMIPAVVLQESRDKAALILAQPRSYVAATVVLCIWLLCIALLVSLW